MSHTGSLFEMDLAIFVYLVQYVTVTVTYWSFMKNPLSQLKNLSPEVDYQALLAQMQTQSHPRRKLKELQKQGCLIRVKKGFYVFTEQFIGREYSPQIVANLLYGPSYLSLEYALSYYQLIPERVVAYTNVTSKKNKNYRTPIGYFSYSHLSSSIYPIGITIKKTFDQRNFLIATPEKALMDIFSLKFKNSDKPKMSDISKALIEDLRIDLNHLKSMINRDLLKQMQPIYKSRRWNQLVIQFLLGSL